MDRVPASPGVARGVATFAAALLVTVACAPAAAPQPTVAPVKPAPTSAPATKPAPTSAPAAKVAPAKPTEAPAATPAQKAAAQAPDKVTFRLDWVINGKLAPFYLAQERGFYQQENIDIEIFEGAGSGKTVVAVGQGQEMFGFADGASVIRSIGEGVPVQLVADILQKSPVGIFSVESSGIKTPADLQGKTLSVVAGGSAATILPALLAINQVDKDKVRVVNLEAGAAPAALATGRVDALNGEVVDLVSAQGLEPGKKFTSIMYADHGVNVIAHGLIANTKTIQDKPELVRRFVRATVRGWEAARERPEDAVGVVLKRFPNTKQDVLLDVLKANLGLLHTQYTQAKPLGWLAKEDLENSLKILKEYGGMTAVKPVETYYTNAYVPGS